MNLNKFLSLKKKKKDQKKRKLSKTEKKENKKQKTSEGSFWNVPKTNSKWTKFPQLYGLFP